MKNTGLIISMLFLLHSMFAQTNTSETIVVGDNFKFKDGVYLNFLQLKTNNPLPKVQIKTKLDYSDMNFFDELTKQKHIIFYDKLGTSHKVKSSKIWGYCNRGVLYINFNDAFNRIPVVGSISHFPAEFTYSSYDPQYSYNHQRNYYDNRNTQTEQRQYLLDLDKGNIYDFNYKSLESLLINDIKLYEEYSVLSKRKKKKLKFFYLRKFNKNNPIKIQISR